MCPGKKPTPMQERHKKKVLRSKMYTNKLTYCYYQLHGNKISNLVTNIEWNQNIGRIYQQIYILLLSAAWNQMMLFFNSKTMKIINSFSLQVFFKQETFPRTSQYQIEGPNTILTKHRRKRKA